MYYKITAGPTSQRNYGLGYSAKDLPIYIDREDVAQYFASIGWLYEEMESADGKVIKCLETPSLNKIITKMEQVLAGKKTGKWRMHKPDDWQARFRYGYDTKEEIITEDFDVMKKFAGDGFRAEVMEGETEVETEVEVEAASNEQIEGEDVEKRGPGRPRNRPLTTPDMPGSARRQT